jgi:F-box and leucine-rich repeat protein 2/20
VVNLFCSFCFFLNCSCVRIGDDGLAALTTGCNKLAMLNLAYCNRITDAGLKCISNLGELSDFELRGLSNITSIGIKAVAVSCKRLANLDLKHCEKLDDTGFRALAFYSQNLLQVSGISFTRLHLLKEKYVQQSSSYKN